MDNLDRPNVVRLSGFSIACQDVGKLLAHAEKIRVLKRQFINWLTEIKPDCVINSPEADCLPNTVSITFPDMNNTGIVICIKNMRVRMLLFFKKQDKIKSINNSKIKSNKNEYE